MDTKAQVLFPSAPRGARWSTNRSTRPCHKKGSLRLMSWLSTCIKERSRQFSPMKTRNRRLPAGVLTPLGARSSGSFWRNGSGTSVLWASEIRPSFFYGRLSRFRFSPATGWDAALSRRSSTLSTRARDVSAMALCGYCMLRVLAIVERVRSASSVKNQRPPSKRDGEVACIGLSLPMHQPRMSPHLHQRTPHPPWLLIQCSGEIGRVAPIGGSW